MFFWSQEEVFIHPGKDLLTPFYPPASGVMESGRIMIMGGVRN
jgi:hypothetical protein